LNAIGVWEKLCVAVDLVNHPSGHGQGQFADILIELQFLKGGPAAVGECEVNGSSACESGLPPIGPAFHNANLKATAGEEAGEQRAYQASAQEEGTGLHSRGKLE
jgi:hypothetical protein